MESSGKAYRIAVLILSLFFLLLGLTLLVTTLVWGGGPASLGVLMGLAFLAVGAARLYLSGVFRGWRGGAGGSDG